MSTWTGSYGLEQGPVWTLVKTATNLGIQKEAKPFLARLTTLLRDVRVFDTLTEMNRVTQRYLTTRELSTERRVKVKAV